ncbi:MAG: hypothetical protein OK452_04285 [Thaumarchaeota archaeon]|nr:hypothetical protein [Nitrososphaerota archaeon]
MPFVRPEEQDEALRNRITLFVLKEIAKRDREWEQALQRRGRVVEQPKKARIPKRFES